jgi:hypothetical protein
MRQRAAAVLLHISADAFCSRNVPTLSRAYWAVLGASLRVPLFAQSRLTFVRKRAAGNAIQPWTTTGELTDRITRPFAQKCLLRKARNCLTYFDDVQ